MFLVAAPGPRHSAQISGGILHGSALDSLSLASAFPNVNNFIPLKMKRRNSMSQCVNKIILVGFLGATPERKLTAQNKPVCSFNLAVNERWKDSDGAPQLLRKPCSGSASFRLDGWQRSAPNFWPKGDT